jgi:hypothetical protein
MMAPEHIGGAIVRRGFSACGRKVRPADTLTREEVLSFAHANLRALVDANFIELVPMAAADASTLHVIHRGSGRFDVIRGIVLNSEPLTREAADAMVDGGSLAKAAA